LLRAGPGDSAEILTNLIPVHTNTTIKDGDGSVFCVSRDADIKVLTTGRFSRGDVEPLLLECIGAVTEKFTEEDLLVRVDGLGHDVEEFACFGFEFALLAS